MLSSMSVTVSLVYIILLIYLSIYLSIYLFIYLSKTYTQLGKKKAEPLLYTIATM